MQPPPKPDKPVKHKAGELKIRTDMETIKAARTKAKKMGWSLSSVVRALLRLWVQEDVISAEDVGEASERAPYKPRKPKPKAKAKGGKR